MLIIFLLAIKRTVHKLYIIKRPPLRSTAHSSWQLIQRSGFDSLRYHTFWEVVCLERGPLSLVSTPEELHGRKSSGSGLEIREYGRTDLSCWPRGTIYPHKLTLTSPTTGGRSVGVVRSRTQTTEFLYIIKKIIYFASCPIVTGQCDWNKLLTEQNTSFVHKVP
jgi:hypothetical protein